MAGWSPVSDDRLTAWVEHAVRAARASEHSFDSAHLESIDPGISAPTSLAAAAELLRRTQPPLAEIGAAGRVQLAVPMGMVPGLDTVPPDLAQWPAPELEPPSLYYLEPSHALLPNDREEYRCPYPPSVIGIDDLQVEFACSRSMFERERGWEFSRTLWLYLAAETELP